MSPTRLKSIFGVEEVGDCVKKFESGKNEGALVITYAPLYEPLNKDTFLQLKPEDQILIAAVAKSFSKIEPESRTFDSILSTLMQNPLAQPDNEKSIARSDTIHMEATEMTNFDGSSDAAIVQKVKNWFAGFVKDDEVFRTVGGGVDSVASIVAKAGANVTEFQSATRREYKHDTVFDVTFLNFPDPVEPYFKLHNVRLVAWTMSHRMGFLQNDQSGITGEYRVRAFTNRTDIISSISEGARSNAVEFAKNLFE